MVRRLLFLNKKKPNFRLPTKIAIVRPIRSGTCAAINRKNSTRVVNVPVAFNKNMCKVNVYMSTSFLKIVIGVFCVILNVCIMCMIRCALCTYYVVLTDNECANNTDCL